MSLSAMTTTATTVSNNSTYLMGFHQNLSTVTPSTIACMSIFDSVTSVPSHIRKILLIHFVFIGTVSFIINSLVMCVIIKTKQLKNQSTRLIFISSLNDVLSFIYSNLSFSVLIMFAEHLSCPLKIALIAGSLFSNLVTLYLICMIAFDRMLHVILLQNYSSTFNNRRYMTCLIVLFTIVVLQVCAWAYGALKEPGLGVKLITPINGFSYIAIVTFYCVSIQRLRNATKNNASVSRDTRSLTKMSSIYVCLFIAISSPVFVYSLLISVMMENLPFWYIAVLTFPCFLTGSVNAIVNGSAFLIKNRQCKEFLNRKLGILKRTITVSSSIPQPAATAAPL